MNSLLNSIKQSRAKSFITVLIVYLISGMGGIFAYFALPFDFWLNLLIADVIATVICFVFSVIFGNASVYDPYWSVQPIVIILPFLFMSEKITWAGILLAVAICVWGVRLTANWAYTFHGLTHQDWRYTMLHDTTGIFYPLINFIGIHMVPTLVVYLCTLPAVFLVKYGAEGNIGNVIFFILSLLAVLLQGTADVQMHAFRRNPAPCKGKFIRNGVWKYSRHPNYLAEISMWWTVGLAVVCAMPDRWYLLAGALANTVLFLAVSIPMAEGKQSKKEGYAEYKAATRMLLPIKK